MTTTQQPSVAIAKCRNGHTIKSTDDRWIGGVYIACACGSRGIAKILQVTIVAERACNGVCMGAQGPSCSCSCGGENHGSRHVFTG